MSFDSPCPEAVCTVDVRCERRFARVAGAAGVASIACQFAAVPVAATDVTDRDGVANDLTFLLSVGQSGSGQLSAMVLRVVSALLLTVLAVFLARAIRGRSPGHSPWVAVLGCASFVLIAATTAYGFFEVRDIAREFVASGSPTLTRAEAMLDEGRQRGLLRASNVGGIFGGVGFGLWVSLTSWDGQRVGLLTRFLGMFGIGAGVCTAVGIPIASFLVMGWTGSVAVLALGYWPGGRPPAWDTGRSEDPEGLPVTAVTRSGTIG